MAEFSSVNQRTRRYGPLRGPSSSSCGVLWPLAKAFFGQEKFYFFAVFVHFRPFLLLI